MKVVPSTYHQCIKFPHQGTKVTIHVNPEPFAYYNAVEASYTNHCPWIDIGRAIANSSHTCNDIETILASTLSTIRINNKGCGEYSLSDAFVVGAIPLDPHTHGRPKYHKAKEISPPWYKQFGPTIFVSSKTPQECLWFQQGRIGCSKKCDHSRWCPQLWVCQSQDLTSFPTYVLQWDIACPFLLVLVHHLDSSIF